MNNPNETPHAGALRWLADMEITADNYVLNAIVLNIYRLSSGIKDVQLVVDSNHKRLLIYVEMTWWQTKFFKKSRILQISDMLDEILPNYTKRVTLDREILRKSVELVKNHGKRE